MSTQEKAAEVLNTPATASNEQCAASLSVAEKTGNPTPKDYSTLQALFALRGYNLCRSHRVPDGRITYIVTRWEQSRSFSHLNDVYAFMTQIGGARV